MWLFILLALVLVYIGPMRTEVHFTNDAGRLPGPFEVTLRSGKRQKKVMVEDGHLHLLRYRWNEIDVTDLSYIRSIYPVREGKMKLVIDRNMLLRLRDAARGHRYDHDADARHAIRHATAGCSGDFQRKSTGGSLSLGHGGRRFVGRGRSRAVT